MISKFRATKGREIQEIEDKINELIDLINLQSEKNPNSKIRLVKYGADDYVVKFQFEDGWVKTTSAALEFDDG